MGLQGAVRGRSFHRRRSPTSRPRPAARSGQPAFVGDAPTSCGCGPDLRGHLARLCYVAFVIDVFSALHRGLARLAFTLRSDLALDALEQALYSTSRSARGLVHHSDRGVQYLSIRYTDRLLEAAIAPSVGSVGDSYDNAMAESVIGLYKTEVIRRRGPWRHVEGGRIRDARMGGLVQQSPPSRADRICAPRRARVGVP